MTAPAPRCTFVKADGNGCRVTWGLVNGLCLSHDPGRRAQAEAARRAGAATTGSLVAAAKGGHGKYRTLAPAQLGGRPARTRAAIERNIAAMTYAEGIGVVDPVTLREYIKGALAHLKLIDTRTLAKDVRALKRDVRAMKRGHAA